MIKFVFLLLILSAQFTQAQGLSCKDYFQNKDLAIYHTEFLQAVDRISVPDVGNIVVYKEVKTVVDTGDRPDPHGTITSLRYILNKSALRFWGYLELANHQTQADVGFVNQRIRQYNMKASSTRQIPLLLETVPTTSTIVSDRSYNRAHSKGLVQVTESGDTRMHDLNYHVFSNMVIPRSFHLESQKKSLIAEKFYQYLEQHNILTPDIQQVMERLLKSRSQDADISANVQVALIHASRQTNMLEHFVQIMIQDHGTLNNYLRPKVSAAKYLESQISQFATSQGSLALLKMYLSHFIRSQTDSSFEVPPTHLPQTEVEMATAIYENYLYFNSLSGRLYDQKPYSSPIIPN